MENQGSGSGPQGRKSWEQHLNEAGARLEEEVRRVVKYVDEEVVPEVRKNSSKALRIAADRLQRLAEQMERSSPPPPGTPPEAPSR
jgi:hypothetical protein